jgi:hypothetical protein
MAQVIREFESHHFRQPLAACGFQRNLLRENVLRFWVLLNKRDAVAWLFGARARRSRAREFLCEPMQAIALILPFR